MSEHVDVLVVGAGLSGIAAGHYLQAECPWADYVILEGRDAIGGTWDLFRYPGIRSDSDLFTFGFSFRPWDRENGIAEGPAIKEYVTETAEIEGITDHIRFGHRVRRASWSSEEAIWTVEAERTDTGETVTFTAGFYFNCSGYYRYDEGYQPEFPGRERFQGTFVHPQFWPEDFDAAGKRIVVIGSGATAITLIPNLVLPDDPDAAEHVTMLQRSPSYIASVPNKNPVVSGARRFLSKERAGAFLRMFFAVVGQLQYRLCRRFPRFMRKVFMAQTKMLLPKDYPVEKHFSPAYNPWDQRVCLVPNGDFFKAISRGDASVVTDTIDTFTETGIRVSSGEELPADIVVSATGLQLLFAGGVEFVVDGERIDLADRFAYKGMMLEGVPNLAFVIGYINASWTLKAELICQRMTRIVNHLRTSGHRQVTPVRGADDFDEAPLLDMSSGYLQRSLDQMPKSAPRDPWKTHQDWFADRRVMQKESIHDGALVFTNPAPADRPVPTPVD